VDTVLGILLLVAAVVTVAYWTDFFIRGSVNVVDEEWYIRFERAFPAADALLAVTSTVAGIGLLVGSPWGIAFGLVAAGGFLFLGLMDTLFNLENGLYRYLPGSGPMWAELVINVSSLVLGAWLLVALVPRVV
jgi:hypothetical protein